MDKYEKATDLVVRLEGCKLTAYPDSGNIWTIGIGTIIYPNGSHVQQGDTCTLDQAKSYLRNHMSLHVFPAMNKFVEGFYCPDDVFAALSSFVYNEGSGRLKDEDLINSFQNQDWQGLADVMKTYNEARVDGILTVIQGLVDRRIIETNYFLKGLV